MNSQEIERLVTAALQSDAEDAMDRTDTTEQLVAFREAGERDAHDRKRLRTLGALAAAAAVAAAVVALSWPGDDRGTAPPVSPPTRTERVTEAEQVGDSFLEALAAFDVTEAATYVDPSAGVTMGTVMSDAAVVDPWDLRNRWDEATGWKVTKAEGCRESHVRATSIDVRCGFTAHQLGSERLGRGPFSGNALVLTVRDGTVTGAVLETAHESNGFASTMWDPFWAWMDRTHPGDETAMAAFEDPGASEARVASSLRLWQQRVRQYVAAVQAGRAQ